jgi:hypothetical protein
MLEPPGRTGERAAALALQLGCEAKEAPPRGLGHGSPAIVGARDGVATALKAYGGRWSAKHRALLFPSWSSLEGALAGILAQQGEKGQS